MAKRANPFLEDFMPQSKMHVGIKQFNNNKERLQDVYDKTLQLLFKGAKKAASTDAIASPVPPSTPHRPSRKLRQLALGTDCALLYDRIVSARVPAPASCPCTERLASWAGGECAYCSRASCGGCARHCARCDRSYCTRCTLIGPEGDEICISCYQ